MTDHEGNRLLPFQEEREAVFRPADGHQERLPAQVLEAFLRRPAAQENAPPGPVRGLEQVGVARTGHRIRPVRRQVTLGQDGIPVPGLVFPHRGIAAEDYLRMLVRSAAFRAHQEIFPVDLVQVRSFDPDRLLGRVHALVHDDSPLADRAIVLHVIFHDADRAVTVVLGLAARRVVVIHDIGPSVVIEEQGRVDALHLRQQDRVRPGAEGVLRLHQEVPRAHIRGNHVVRPVRRVVLDVRGKDAAARMLAAEARQLRRAVQDVTDLLPVYQIAAVEDRDAREIAEGGRDQEIVSFSVRAEARIGIPARQDGVVHHILSGQGMRLVIGVPALVPETLEDGHSGRNGRLTSHERQTHSQSW